MSYFLQKTTKKCIFGLILKNPRKTQGPFENPRKTQGPQKKPKNPRLLRKTQDLGRKPKQWQRCFSANTRSQVKSSQISFIAWKIRKIGDSWNRNYRQLGQKLPVLLKP